MSHHLVGPAEVAGMLGVSRQRVAQLPAAYDDFPAPEVELAGGRIWSRTAIETWIANHPERGRESVEPSEKPSKVRRFVERLGGSWFARFTDRARSAVISAQEQARLLRHNYIGTEHLLLGLVTINGGAARDALASLGITTEAVRERIRDVVGEGTDMPQGHIPFTPRAKKVLEMALREALKLGHNYIGTEHILLSIASEPDGLGWKCLEDLGVDEADLRHAVMEAIVRTVSGRRMSQAPRGKDLLKCSFCGKTQEQAERLVAGPGVYICNECIELCVEIVRDESASPPESGSGIGVGISARDPLHAKLEELTARIEELESRLDDDG